MFCTKQASYRTSGPIPHGPAPYEEFFSWGSRHHCPMEVGAYGYNGHACFYWSVRVALRSTNCLQLLVVLKNGTAVGLPVTLLSVTSNEPMAHNTQDGSVV